MKCESLRRRQRLTTRREVQVVLHLGRRVRCSGLSLFFYPARNGNSPCWSVKNWVPRTLETNTSAGLAKPFGATGPTYLHQAIKTCVFIKRPVIFTMSRPRFSKLTGWLSKLAVALIRFYQVVLSSAFGGQCRFYPSCSEYSRRAFIKYGPVKAAGRTLWRLARCNPLNPGGVDEP